MIIKEKERPGVKLLIEEQDFNGKRYKISDNYVPEIDIDDKVVSISIFHEDQIDKYEEIHGLLLYHEEISSFILFNDKKSSTHSGEYLEDKLYYYNEIMDGFEELINSGKSEFTDKALSVLDKMKEIAKKVGSSKNAI